MITWIPYTGYGTVEQREKPPRNESFTQRDIYNIYIYMYVYIRTVSLGRSLPIDSTQGMRKRTRAGMGGCQAKPWNYGCECRVAQIIARESAVLTPDVVGRR
jgi:hypothetical protein